jgi:2-amino-4-hydroxy-6-hydroxymethyldihydropteridine diphosphokinase
MRYRYILSLGANLGRRKFNCMAAIVILGEFSKIIQKSSFIETLPLDCKKYSNKGHSSYINLVLEILTDLSALDLYKKIIKIEDSMGHNRERKWLPRYIDIDILLWVLNTADSFSCCPAIAYNKDLFSVPHNEFWKRDFLISLCKEDLALSSSCLQEHRHLRKNRCVLL